MNFDDTARFFGPSEKLWPELFATANKTATKLCRHCRKVKVEGIRRYCGSCAHKRKLEATRDSKRANRGRDGRKIENSLIGAQALMDAENKVRCVDTRQHEEAGFSSKVKRKVT